MPTWCATSRDGLRVEEVARVHGGRELQVAADQEPHHFALLPAASGCAPWRLRHEPQRGVHVAFAGRALADVVKQQREGQHAGLLDLGQQVAEGCGTRRRSWSRSSQRFWMATRVCSSTV